MSTNRIAIVYIRAREARTRAERTGALGETLPDRSLLRPQALELRLRPRYLVESVPNER
ncbi:MAG: hypothetical protein ACOCY8_02055 [Spirochaetota bacterium]